MRRIGKKILMLVWLMCLGIGIIYGSSTSFNKENNTMDLADSGIGEAASAVPVKLNGFSVINTGLPSSVTLLESEALPIRQSNVLNLTPGKTYILMFDYVTSGSKNKFNVDFYPDSLPEIFPEATGTIQHYQWNVKSNNSDMSNCRIRFFDNQKASSDQNITISTIVFLDINSSSKATFMIEVGRKLGGMLPTIPKDGYTFDGWYTSSTGGTKVNSETVVTNTLNLYPRWKEITATSVKLNKTKLDLEKDKSATLTATISPSNVYNKTITWTSSNTSVATVNSSGKVTGKASGTATITAKTSNGKTATCTVNVTENYIEAYFLNTINKAGFKDVKNGYGNNNAFIFKTNNNKYILLDTGTTYTDDNLPAKEIIDLIYNKLKELQNKNVVTLDYMIISHMHYDHAGNASAILADSRFNIKNTIFKREKAKNLDEEIYDAAVKNGKTNIIEVNKKLQDGAYYTLSNSVKMYLFNLKDVFDGAKGCRNISYFNFLIDNFRDKTALRDGGPNTGDNEYVYFNGLDYFSNESNFVFHSRVKKPDSNENNTVDYLNNKFYVIRQDNGNNCNANTNSIVVVFQVKTSQGNKYVYLPADLENNGYDPFGEYDENLKATIHGGISSYPYYYRESGNGLSYAFHDSMSNRLKLGYYKLFPIAAEYIVAKQVTNKFSDIKGNITIYQESHHGLNNAPEALELLNVNKNSTYSITPTGTNPKTSYQFRALRGQYYLKNSNIMYTGGENKNGIKCIINDTGKTACNNY